MWVRPAAWTACLLEMASALMLEAIQGPSSHAAEETVRSQERLAVSLAQEAVRTQAMQMPWLDD